VAVKVTDQLLGDGMLHTPYGIWLSIARLPKELPLGK
jgi:hypothetical protein